MERLLALWLAPLEHERPDGAALRTTQALCDALERICPFVEAVRPGLFVLPVRGPSRFFGGDEAVVSAVRHVLGEVAGLDGALGIGEGLFCAEEAARRGVLLAPGASDSFRRALAIESLEREDLAATCRRLGLHTVGAFADLDSARVAERFDADALIRQRVARGELDELAGRRDRALERRLARLRGEEDFDEQIGFFGQRGAGDERAEEAARRVRHRLGPEALLVGAVGEGRTPAERARLVPWGSPPSPPVSAAPWPGRLHAPSPATTLRRPVAIEVCDARGRVVELDARGLLSAPPAAVLFGATMRRDVTWFAGPWPLVERWWARHRRRAHLQVVLDSGEALLVAREAGRWWLAGIYD